MTDVNDQVFSPRRARKRAPRDAMFHQRPCEGPAYHALVIGVSRYRHLPGGRGPKATSALAAGLTQLSAAATSALQVALWIRDKYDPPDVNGGSIRLLLSPAPTEGISLDDLVRSATSANVAAAVAGWRRDVRSHEANIALLYVAGHGIQRTMEGGIVLLEDFADPTALTALTGAIDVQSVRGGIVADPTQADTCTPKRQFYFYDACRVNLPADAQFESLTAGITLDTPRGKAPDASWVSFGSRPRDYAFADAKHRFTLYSKAFMECLDTRASVDKDGRTVRLTEFQTALEEYLPELSQQFKEDQRATLGGWGSITAPVHRRPGPALPSSHDTRPVRFDVVPQLPVVALTGAQLMGETDGRHQLLQLPVGHEYEAIVPLPWGGEHITRFRVPKVGVDEVTVRIMIGSAEPHQAPTVAGPTPIEMSGPYEGYCALRFLRWREGSWESDDFPYEISYERLITGDIRLLVWVGGAAHNHPIPGVEVAPPFVQIDSERGRSPLTALPLSEGTASRCEVFVSFRKSGVVATARPTDWNAAAVAGYLQSGRADRAFTAMSVEAEELLRGKRVNPIAAAIGGYALLKLNDLEKIRDWCDNLADWFPSLPDGAVIAGVVASRRGQLEAARGWFAIATERGIPVFSEGLSLLVAEAPATGLLGRLNAIADSALTADFSMLCTTLYTPGEEDDRGWFEILPRVSAPTIGISHQEDETEILLSRGEIETRFDEPPPEANAYE